jgi:hypothetical protein
MTNDTFMPGFTEQQRDDYLDWYEQQQFKEYDDWMNHLEELYEQQLIDSEEDDTATHPSATDTSA